MIRFGIVGCGLIGAKRAAALAKGALVVACDVVVERAQKLAAAYPGARASSDWREVARDPGVDAVIVATTHDQLAPVGLECLRNGKHLLLEKPASRTPEELLPLVAESEARNLVVKIGFNHRFHPAIQQAKSMFDSGQVGPLMMIRGRYGHGGRPGYDKEWRARPELSGGGELLDQGMHLIDLSNWFMGGVAKSWGRTERLYWDMPVEDNAFLYLKGASGAPAWLHVSWTEWKNLFSLEIYGRTGKLVVEGLGGSYGPERLIYYNMGEITRPPDVRAFEYTAPDESWSKDTRNFIDAVESGSPVCGGVRDALEALRVVKDVYMRESQ